jgi:hypothetical protein
MLNLHKNQELFWLLEVLLLTPVALFWSGVVSMMISGSNRLFLSVVGQPFEPIRSILVTMVCPAAAAWFAYDYLSKNKREKSQTQTFAKLIIVVSVATIVLVVFYLYGENRPR